MNDFSELWRLYKYARGDGSPFNALENFTTEALAIAITHDQAPMLDALRRLDWGVGGTPMKPEVDGLGIKTQRYIRQPGLKSGFLDLVLVLMAGETESSEVWVEVKVDAKESGKQREVYESHIAREGGPSARLITLSREPLPEWPVWLPWVELHAAAGASPAWMDFALWLRENRLHVDPRVVERMDSAELTDVEVESILDVLHDANGSIRRRWPRAQPTYHWRDDPSLDRNARAMSAKGGGFVTTGGPLSYGYVMDREAPEWFVSVRTDSWGKAPVDLVAYVDEVGLPEDWERRNDSRAVLTKRIRVADRKLRRAASAWFDAAIDEVDQFRIMDWIDPERTNRGR